MTNEQLNYVGYQVFMLVSKPFLTTCATGLIIPCATKDLGIAIWQFAQSYEVEMTDVMRIVMHQVFLYILILLLSICDYARSQPHGGPEVIA